MTYEALRPRLLALDVPEGSLHAPSAIEAWLTWAREDFFDLEALEGFRRRRSHLHGGTMNWPNRDESALQWMYDEATGRTVASATAPDRRALRAWRTLRGFEHLVRGDRAARAAFPDDLRALLSDTLVGEPFHVRMPSGRIVTEPLLRHTYYAGQLLRHGLLGPGTIMELGPGYGGLARLLGRLSPSTRFVLVDLPQRLSLQAYYLGRSDPSKVVELFDGDYPERFDVLLVPTWRVRDLPDGAITGVVATHSLQEMSKEQVDFYLGQVDRLASGWFYNVNRKEKRVGDEHLGHAGAPPGWTKVFDHDQPGYERILEALYLTAAHPRARP